MADTKISALPASTTPLTGTETLPIVQNGVTKQVSVANLTAGRGVGSAGGTFTDNFTQGVAAKGVNFSANTPAAGMTSQLLNVYEEGAWTPNQGAGLTVIGTFSANGKYVRVGRMVTVSVYMYATTSIAAVAGNYICTNLPFTPASYVFTGSATNNGATINAGICTLGANILATESIAANPAIQFSITYFV